MDTTLAICATVIAALGILGCIVPVVPGPVVAWSGLLLLLFTTSAPSWVLLAGWGVACAAVVATDALLPPVVSRRFGGGRAGMWGSLAGSLVGLSFFPIGVILGAFLGAFAFEKIFAKRTWRDSAVAGTGAFLGFLLGTALKIGYCIACLFVIWS